MGRMLTERAQQGATAPTAGRMGPELQREDIQEVFSRTYHIREQGIDTLAVFEGHRRFDTTDLHELDR